MELKELTKLDLPVPPDFDRALGYEGDNRFVALYWMPTGDELRYTDGWISADGEHQAWLLWTRHISTGTTFLSYHFGSSDETARHWLLLDRKERRVYVGEAGQVARFFQELPEIAEARRAWQALEFEEQQRIQAEMWESLQKALENVTGVTEMDAEVIKRRARQAYRRYRKLALWLDQQEVTCSGCGSRRHAALWYADQLMCREYGQMYWIAVMEAGNPGGPAGDSREDQVSF